jgi:hypothetical protein
MKRAAAKISRSQYEVYSFATGHNLSEAATDELLQIVGNVTTELNMGPLATKLRTEILNCASAANAFKLLCDQARFDSSDIRLKTMKTMDKTARLPMLPDHQIFCVDLTDGNLK